MAKWTAVITDAGTALQTSQVKGSVITLTRAVSGGSVTAISSLKTLTSMSNIVQTLSLGTLKLDKVNSTFTVMVTLSNEEVTSKYNLRQVGIFAKDSQTNKEILFAIAQIDEAKSIDTPANAPGYNIEWQFTFANPNDNEMAVIINNESLQEQMTYLQNNVSPSGEAEGKVIAINNSANLPLVNLNVYGKSEQAISNGYQLFDASRINTRTVGGATVTNNGDGSFTVSGSGNLSATYSYHYECTHEETLALLKPGPIAINENNVTPAIEACIYYNGGYEYYTLVSGRALTGEVTEEMLAHEDACLRIYMYGYNGQPIKAGTIKPMLYQDGNGVWEPYTGGIPGPNPDYPLEITNVGDSGSVEVGVYAKNLVNVEDVEINNFTGHHTPIPLGFKVVVGQTYTISMDIESTVEPFITSVGLGSESAYYLDAGYGSNQNNGRAVITFTPTKKQVSQGAYLHIRAPRYSESTTFSAKISNIQLEIGSVATEYEPGKGQKLTLSIPNGLPGLPVNNGGNYVDEDGKHWLCDEVDLERGVYIQRVKYRQLGTNEGWNKGADDQQTDNTTLFYCYPSDKKYGAENLMCNTLPVKNILGANHDYIGIYGSIANYLIYVRVEGVLTVDEFKTWITEHPTYVLYSLETPIEIALTDEEMQVYRAITTNNPNTIIMNDIKADMKAQYVPQLYGPLIGMIFNRMNTLMGDITAAIDEINGEVV